MWGLIFFHLIHDGNVAHNLRHKLLKKHEKQPRIFSHIKVVKFAKTSPNICEKLEYWIILHTFVRETVLCINGFNTDACKVGIILLPDIRFFIPIYTDQ